jgi:putative acetyltransferase
MRNVLIQTNDPASPPARELIERLDKYLADLYPAESNHLLSVEALQQPSVTFLTASVDGAVAGCGSFVHQRGQGGEYAEIKRMFVLPEFRGLKLGRRILDEIENLARASGLKLALLETGIYQPEALHLYKNAGYQPRGPFGDYAEDPLSIFMEKKL